MSVTNPPDSVTPRWASFDEYRLDLKNNQMYQNGKRLGLPIRAVRVLVVLVMNHGELVEREALATLVWGEQNIDPESNLNTAIRSIRRVLSDNPTSPRFIETAPRQGYRFLLTPGFSESRPQMRSLNDLSDRSSSNRHLSIAATAVLVVAGLVMAALWFQTEGVAPPDNMAQVDSGQSLMQAYVSSPGYEDYMHGRYALSQGERERARSHLQAAIDADTRMAPAYISLARILVGERRLGFDRILEAQALARKALAIDDRLVAAHVLNAGLALYYWRDQQRSRDHIDRALNLAPNDPDALVIEAYHNVIWGDADVAVEAIAKAHQLRPLSPSLNADYGWILYKAGHWLDAERMCKTSVELRQNSTFALECVIHINHSQGDRAESVDYGLKLMALRGAETGEINRIRQISDAAERELAYWAWTLSWLENNSGQMSDVHSRTGIALTMMGRHNDAVRVFEYAFRQNGEPFLAFLAVDPRVEELTAHAQFPVLAGMSQSPLEMP